MQNVRCPLANVYVCGCLKDRNILEEPIFGDITILTCVYKQFLTYVTHNMEDRVKTVVWC